MLIQVGSYEMLLSDSELVAEKAKKAGCKVRLSIYEGMFHVFQMALLVMPESRRACGKWKVPGDYSAGLRTAIMKRHKEDGMQMADLKSWRKDCTLCPRNCHADRSAGQLGFCRSSDRIRAARAALHYWEEPCISGEDGSGAVFFSGCSLGCVYCQNRPIAEGSVGKEISAERLAEIFLELQGQGAWNINLITAAHFVPQVAESLRTAKSQGLKIPVVYNSSGYEKVETLKLLEGLVDIYLPDLKYLDPALAKRYSSARIIRRRRRLRWRRW